MPAINRTLRLKENEYMPEVQPKDLIVLHHTEGASAKSTFDYWNGDNRTIATAFIVERDGTIFEVFDPKQWAHHLGIKGTGGKHDKRSIGIEIACEGVLTPKDGKYFAFGREFKGEPFDHGKPWRDGKRYFAAYPAKQIAAVADLVDELCTTFAIRRRTPKDPLAFDAALLDYTGVVAHHHVRADKLDLHPGFDWTSLIGRCNLALE